MVELGRLLRLYVGAAVAQVVFKIVRNFLRRRAMLKMLAPIPTVHGPAPHPLLGHVGEMVKHLHTMYDWRMEATKGLPRSKMLMPAWEAEAFVLMRRPEDVKHVLKDAFSKYSKAGPERDAFWFYFNEWLGEGIFVLPHGVGARDGGDKWQRQRKIASNIFNRANMNGLMKSVFNENAAHAVNVIRPGETLDIQTLFFRFTMDSIMAVFFGEKTNTLEGQSSAYGSAYDQAHRALTKFFFESLPFNSFLEILPFPLEGKGGPVGRLHRWMNKDWQEVVEAKKVLDSEAQRIIEQSYADPNLPTRCDLLSLYMNDPEIKAMPTAERYTYLRDTVLNFVIAGRDTTACTLTWMFYILCQHPDLQREIHEEIDQKLPATQPMGIAELAHGNVPKLHALLYETLRLYPPVPFDEKVCMEDDELPDGTKIPKGTHMAFVPYSQGRDPELWTNPEKVDLSRWIPFKAPSPYEFPVFQAGPRICLGMDMAIYEAKLAAANLLREYSFTLAPGEAEKITYSLMITMSLCNNKDQTSHELNVIPTRRVKKE